MALFKANRKETAPKEIEAPVYAKGSTGDVKTYDVEPRKVAMIMAIVAEQVDIPLNQLRFISIKEVTE